MDFFNLGSQKQMVGIAVTPHMGVEVIVIDKKTRMVEKYGQRNLEYDSAKREVEDYSALKSAIIELFDELDLNRKSSVYVILPNVHFGFMDLLSSMDDDAINTMMLAKTEESYIFKKTEPLLAYTDASSNTAADSRYLVYSAVQKDAVEKIKDIFSEIGCTLIGIEGSHSAIFRGIDYTGLAADVIEQNQNWDLLLINNNSYSIFALAGNNIFDYIEVPLAIKSLSYEEAYQAISSSIAQNLPNYPAKKLLIISQTDDICADVLKTQISFEEEIETLDCNKYTKQPCVDVSQNILTDEAKNISLSAIGSGSYQASNMGFTLNIFDKNAGASVTLNFSLFGNDITITPEAASSGLAIAAVVILGICAFLSGVFFLGGRYFEDQNIALQMEKDRIKAEIDSYTPAEESVNINTLISAIVANNKKTIGYYDSLSMDIPKNVWLTYYYSREGDNVSIEGLAMGINEIYEYYRGIKNSIPTSSIKLNRLRALTDVINNTYDPNAKNETKLYDFEISNTTSKKAGGGIVEADPNVTSDDGIDDAFKMNSQDVPTAGQSGSPMLEPIKMTN